MTITGHRTRSVFDRYHIAAPEDLRAAAARIAARSASRDRGGLSRPSRGCPSPKLHPVGKWLIDQL